MGDVASPACSGTGEPACSGTGEVACSPSGEVACAASGEVSFETCNGTATGVTDCRNGAESKKLLVKSSFCRLSDCLSHFDSTVYLYNSFVLKAACLDTMQLRLEYNGDLYN